MVAPVVERGVGEERVGDLVRRCGPFEREEEELRLECGGLLAEPRDERTAGGFGHVRGEHEVRVGQRPDGRRLDPLVLGDRVREARRVELRHLPVVALAERRGVGLGLRDLVVDARVVDSLVEVGEVPRNLFRAGDLGRRHAGQSSGRAGPRA